MALSALFRSKVTVHGHSPEHFLQLTRKCMEQAQKMTTPSVISTSAEFNYGQCNYLADKLTMAVKSALSFTLRLSTRSHPEMDMDMENCLEVFKLLYALANVVEDFIGRCCQDAWIEAAVLLSNVSKHISSTGFNLELARLYFLGSLTLTTVDHIYRDEVKMIEEKASQDREMLLRNVKALLETRRSTSTEYKLAALLLERHEHASLQKDKYRPHEAGGLLEAFEIDKESLIQMGQLGKGSFATVFRASWQGMQVAKKTFYTRDCQDFEKEVSILQRLWHPNITSLLGYVKEERECSIVMEVMDEDLFGLIHRKMKEHKKRGYPFDILEAIDMMLQVGSGMQYLHEMRIVHRDLKSMNILVKYVKARNLGIEYVWAKVSDFGLSRTKERSLTFSNQTPNMGTTRWMAPEMIRLYTPERPIGISAVDAMIAKRPFSSDVYSFGMVCYEILTGEVPYFEECYPNEVKKKVLNGDRPELPNRCPENLRNMTERCWSADASQRPGFGEICAELRYLKYVLLRARSRNNRCMGGASATISVPVPLVRNGLPQLRYTLAQVMAATNSLEKRVGVEGFGVSEHYGKLASGQEVAVKVVANSGQISQEIIDKVWRVQKVCHRNLVSVVGYCDEGRNLILLYEYMPLNNLHSRLYRVGAQEEESFLDWKTRLRIALNSARGLEYLHVGCHPVIIHRNVNSNNILLDDKLRPKVAGFGLPKLTEPMGTVGYLDPEFVVSRQLTDKSDVYAFGIVMLELICARPPFVPQLPGGQRQIDKWVWPLLQAGTIEEIVDPALGGYYNLDAMRKVAEVAMQSVEPRAIHRPDMSTIVYELRAALVLENCGPKWIDQKVHQESTSGPSTSAGT